MNKPDWEAIEMQYRAGTQSLREIAGQHGVSDTAIRKRAKRDDWTRDLSAKVKAKADALVRKKEVREQVRAENANNERMLIEASAEVISTVRMEHRGDIRRARDLVNRMFDEACAQSGAAEELAMLGELLKAPPEAGRDKLNEAYHAAISLPERVKSVKALTESLRLLIGLEREAYDIGGPEKDKTGEVLSDLMDQLAKGGG